MMWFHVSDPNTYLVITGAGIDTVKIQKKAFVLPFQRVTKISITPFDFSMSLHAMTSEKLKFSLPAVFTIGPRDERKSLEKYAVLLTGNSDGRTIKSTSGTVTPGRNHVQDTVKGVIEGETRSIVSTMTMEELFNNRQIFKAKVIQHVQAELDQFGLCIYNANVKELQDMPGSQYFEFLSKKAHEGAQNQAKVDVANARMIGEVGEAERQGETKQKIAKINAHTAVLETERKIEQAAADSELKRRQIDLERGLTLERISAGRAAEEREAELQKTVEQKRAEAELERLRATTVTKAKIDRESAQEKADASVYSATKAADAKKYAENADAEARLYKAAKDADAALYTRAQAAEAGLVAQRKEAEATFVAKTRIAEADLVARQKEAQGLLEMAKAYGALADVLGGPAGLMQWFMLQNGVYERMAEANAKAVQGLQPKISVWNTGAAEGAGVDSMAPIRNLLQMMPPMLQTIQDQTGVEPPSWLAGMPQTQTQGADLPGMKNGQIITNGIGGKNGMVNGHDGVDGGK